MSDDSLEFRRRATEASFQLSLAKFRNPQYEPEGVASYLGPIDQSLAFRSAIGSHMRKTNRELMTHPDAIHTSWVARPVNEITPGVLIELRSFLGGRTVETHYTYYDKNEDPTIADTFKEVTFPATTLANGLKFAPGTRDVFDTDYQDKQRAARQILTELFHEGCIDPESEQPAIEGTVKWATKNETGNIHIEFPDKGLCWKYDGTRLRKLEATP